jgi:hypothetical protein
MSVSAAVDIANIALQRLGQPTISTLTESSRDATICNQLYDQNRDYCLMLADWDCLVNRQTLERSGKVAISAATAADPVEITCATHTFIANELIHVESITGMTQLNDLSYRVYSYTSTTIVLYGLDGTSIDGSSYTAWTSGGYVYRDPSANWAFVYDLPTDCLKVLHVLDEEGGTDTSYTWRKERTHLYTNIEAAGVRYVKKETDPSLYESDLVEVIAARLAWYISMRIHSDKTLRNGIYQEMQAAMARARMTNAAGSVDEGEPEASWTGVW